MSVEQCPSAPDEPEPDRNHANLRVVGGGEIVMVGTHSEDTEEAYIRSNYVVSF